MKTQILALTLASAILASSSSHAFHQITNDVTDDEGNVTTTYTNVDDDGSESYGGQVINYSNGVAEQMNESGQLISTWGGGQDAATISYQVQDTFIPGLSFVSQIWTRTDSDGNQYDGGRVISSSLGGSSQFDSDFQLMNSWGW